MSRISSSRFRLVSLSLFALLLAAGCTSPSRQPSTEAAAPASPLQSLTYSGDQQPLESLDHEIAAAGNDSATLEAIARRLIALLRAPDTTFAARQAICQRLGMFPANILASPDATSVFAAMLADEKQFNLARLALEQVPGEAIDALYLHALENSSGSIRFAMVQSVGNRHLTAAIPQLAPLLNPNNPTASDVALQNAAAKALGQIGTADALAALRSAHDLASPDIVEAELLAAYHLGGSDAIGVFQEILDRPRAPANLRAAALHGLLFANPAEAPARIVDAMSHGDAVLKPVIIEAIASLPGKKLVPDLAAQLGAWDASTEAAVIAALGEKRDAAALPAIGAATKNADPSVRAAAIAALGRLPGRPETAILLAQIVAGKNSDDAKLARQSLARLDGPGVSEAIVDGATTKAEPLLRAVFLESLASRYMTATVPLLLNVHSDPNPAVRAAALAALAELAPASEQKPILDWTIAADNPAEETRALRALVNVSLRNPDVNARSLPIISALEQASPAVSIRLLPLLPRLGGAAAAECAANLATREDPSVSSAAIANLARWPDRTGLVQLVNVAEKAPRDAVRAAAVQGATRYLLRNHELPSAELSANVSRLLATTQDAPARARLVFLLGRCKDDNALALTQKLQGDPALAADARDAALAIQSNRAGPPALRSSHGNYGLEHIFDRNLSTRWAAPVEAGTWIEIDFKSTRPIRQLVLDQGAQQDDYPEHYEVFVTDDPNNLGAAVASGPGQRNKTIIDVPEGTRGRYVIIKNTADREGAWWSINELLVD